MIHVFVGTKAQLIKMAPIMRELEERNIQYNFVFSGQHQETIDQLRNNFSIKAPDVVLHSGSDVTSITQMLRWGIKIFFRSLFSRSSIWAGDKNGIVLNHGDTFSTLLGSLLAKALGFKNAHIESGLRSFNLLHPFPEELTRVIVFRLSDYYFVPDATALANLSKHKGVKINTEANTLYDTLRLFLKNESHKLITNSFTKFGLVSLHRYENIFNEEQFETIIQLLEKVARKIPLVFILHKPTKKKLLAFGFYERLKQNPNIELHPRYDYFDFITLVQKSEFLITDGGSNQEECYYLGHPCLLFRKATERQEGLGENVVLSEFKLETIEKFIHDYKSFSRSPLELPVSPSKRIVDELMRMRG